MPPWPDRSEIVWSLIVVVAFLHAAAVVAADGGNADLIVPHCGRSQAFPNHRKPKFVTESSGQNTKRNRWRMLPMFGREEVEEEEERGRILQGTKASKGAWPWQVSIQLELSNVGSVGHWCGGVLVHQHWVLTAAHCIENPLFTDFGRITWTVILSDFDRNFLGNDGEIVLPVDEVIIHPKFHEYQNDIAMLRLPSDPRILRLSPACLPATPVTRNESFLGLRCLATGWGQTTFGGELQANLHQVELSVVDNVYCKVAYAASYNISILEHHICAGPIHAGGKGTCVGDSGGPIHCNMKDGRWYLAGITSFGSGCAKPGFPDVFTRLTSYVDWIKVTMDREAASVSSAIPRK